MNERIRELAGQANVRPLYSPAYAPRYIFEEEELEKFAELIVRECAELCVLNVVDEICGGKDFSDKIKKHFGVEE